MIRACQSPDTIQNNTTPNGEVLLPFHIWSRRQCWYWWWEWI